MSFRQMKTVDIGNTHNFKINLEIFDNGFEVAEVSSTRPITDCRFTNYRDKNRSFDSSFNGVENFDEAMNLMKFGYQPVVDSLKGVKPNVDGMGKRTTFHNQVVGFAPVVPLVLQGIPNCMVNSYTKPIKNKVLNVYYDVGAVGSITTSEIKRAGEKLLSALLRLELEGYRFNIFACKSQTAHDKSADMFCVKIKDAASPFDLKRMSFPLAHPAFFRCIGWDWYSRVPDGKWRSGYGHSLTYEFSCKELTKAFEDMFRQKCVVLGCKYILDRNEDYIREVLTGGKI